MSRYAAKQIVLDNQVMTHMYRFTAPIVASEIASRHIYSEFNEIYRFD